MWLVVAALVLVLSTVGLSIDFTYEYGESEADSNDVVGECRCVEWSLCDEMGYIITDGSDKLLSTRNLFAPTCEECGECPSSHVCCEEPIESEESTEPEGLSWDRCGLNKYHNLPIEPRVMNLDILISETRFGEFPWTLMMFRAQKLPNGRWQKYMFRGGASIIHPKIALTAAHLLWGANASLITLRAGEWNATSTTEQIPHQDRSVKKIIVHPGFSRYHLRNNIALLILDEPFEIADNVASVCLPSPGVSYDRNNCFAAGWGTNRFGPNGRYSTTQRKVQLPIVSQEECENKLRRSKLGQRFSLHNSFMCAGGKIGQDTCLGDGGGPLMCLQDDGAYVQVGIVSWGVQCGLEYPAVYTDVSKLLPWILQVPEVSSELKT